MTRLDRLRAAYKYSSGADRQAIRAMILEIENGFTDPTRAEVVDPEPKPLEVLEAAVDGAGSSSETNARANVAGGVTAGETATDPNVRHCVHCGAPFHRRKGISRPQFAKQRYCSQRCSNKVIANARGTAGGSAKATAARARRVRAVQAIESPGEWLVYFAARPTRNAASLTEARARARAAGERYAEIANLETGRHLMLFNGSWIEMWPTGSPILGRAA